MENLKTGDLVILTKSFSDENTSTYSLPAGLKGTVVDLKSGGLVVVMFDSFKTPRWIPDNCLERI